MLTTFKLITQFLAVKQPSLNIKTLLDKKGKSPMDYATPNIKQALIAS